MQAAYKNRSRPSPGPIFQRRHYEAIAAAIARIPDENARDHAEIVMSNMLGDDNDKFKPSLFQLAALGKIKI